MLNLVNLSKTFKNGSALIHAVKNISFELPKGQVISLLGPNGSGKTTTIKMICGLLHPTSGKVFIDSIDLQENSKEYLSSISVVLEGTRNIHWRLTPYENVEFYLRLRGKKSRQNKERIDYFVERLNLIPYRNTECRYLSKGNQQKVAVLCAFSLDTKVVLLDEPTLGLDIEVAQSLFALIDEESSNGKSILIASHNFELVEDVSDTLVIIHHGRKLETITPQDMLHKFGNNSNRLSNAYLNLMNSHTFFQEDRGHTYA